MITKCHNSLSSFEGASLKTNTSFYPTSTKQMFNLQAELTTTKYNNLEMLKQRKFTIKYAKPQIANYKGTTSV